MKSGLRLPALSALPAARARSLPAFDPARTFSPCLAGALPCPPSTPTPYRNPTSHPNLPPHSTRRPILRLLDGCAGKVGPQQAALLPAGKRGGAGRVGASSGGAPSTRLLPRLSVCSYDAPGAARQGQRARRWARQRGWRAPLLLMCPLVFLQDDRTAYVPASSLLLVDFELHACEEVGQCSTKQYTGLLPFPAPSGRAAAPSLALCFTFQSTAASAACPVRTQLARSTICRSRPWLVICPVPSSPL